MFYTGQIVWCGLNNTLIVDDMGIVGVIDGRSIGISNTAVTTIHVVGGPGGFTLGRDLRSIGRALGLIKIFKLAFTQLALLGRIV